MTQAPFAASLPVLVFIRHGQTDWNVSGRLQGQTDIPLNDRGRAQAKRNADAVRATHPEVASYDFVASPLVRAQETMRIVRADLGLALDGYRLDDRLKEVAYGAWEGETTDGIAARDPAIIAARHKDKWGFVPPGGESYEMLGDRVDAWLASLARPTLAVAHGGVGRILLIRLLGRDPHAVISEEFPQDKVLVFRDGRSEWV